MIGNRIYGCDDCQLICPWNKFASPSHVGDFSERNQLGKISLVEIFSWTRDDFDQKMKGSAIYRIGYEQFMRNVAVSLGNLLRHPDTLGDDRVYVRSQLRQQDQRIDAIVDEHITWALKD
jgi:epoxyqueuosine reductase